jgi:hypothetical protein
MKQLAIRLSWQTTPAKSLVMRGNMLFWSAQTRLRLGKAATRRRTPKQCDFYAKQDEQYELSP